jgi:hypothetical protein
MVSLSRVRLLLTASLVMLITALTATSAQAHSRCVYQGNDFGCGNADHNRISACDYESDGNYVYTEALIGGQSDTYTVLDGNGSAAGCGVRQGLRFRYIRVCEDTAGYPDTCTRWVEA